MHASAVWRKCAYYLEARINGCHTVAFSPDGKILAGSEHFKDKRHYGDRKT